MCARPAAPIAPPRLDRQRQQFGGAIGEGFGVSGTDDAPAVFVDQVRAATYIGRDYGNFHRQRLLDRARQPLLL